MRYALIALGLAALVLGACGEKAPRSESAVEPASAASEPQAHDLGSRTLRQSESTRIYH